MVRTYYFANFHHLSNAKHMLVAEMRGVLPHLAAKRAARLPLLPSVVTSLAHNNSFLSPSYHEDMALFIIFSQTGFRSSSVAHLTLSSFQNVTYSQETGKVTLILSFNHLKRQQPGKAISRCFSGYLWPTLNVDNDLIYHLHHFLVNKTATADSPCGQGILTLNFPTLKDPIYPPHLDPNLSTPSLEALRSVHPTHITTIAEFARFHEEAAHEMPLWSRHSKDGSHLRKILRKVRMCS